MQFLEFLAQKIYPLFSNRVNNPLRCTQCLLTNEVSYIHNDGVCTECHNFQFKIEKSNKAALKFYERKAIIMMSGGKDSAYLLSQLIYNYPTVDFTAVLVDNGFMAPNAKKNAIRVCKIFNCPLVIIDQHKNKFYEAFRNALIHLNKQPCYQSIDGVDGDLTFKLVSDYALIHGFKTVVTGLSKEQLHRIFDTNFHVYIDSNRIRILNPLALWNSNESEIRKYVVENNLIKQAGPLATNSELVILMGILDTKNLGYSSFEPEFASLIRQGKADREYWVNMFNFLKFATDRGYFDWIANRILKKFDLTLKDVT